MFEPAPYRVVGFVPNDAEKSDPVNDPELIAEAVQHAWVEADLGGGFISLDPSFKDALIDQTFGSKQQQLHEVPDELRHKVTVRLITEFAGTALNPGLERSTVMSETFTSAELVGKPLSIGHFVDTQVEGGLAFSNFIHTYSPYLLIGQNDGDLSDDPIIRGEDYQEYFSGLFGGLANSMLTGVFVEIEVITPQQKTEVFERTLLDRIGFANRRGTGGQQIAGINNPEIASIQPSDIFTLSASVASHSPPQDLISVDEITSLMEESRQITEILDQADIDNLSDSETQLVSRLINLNTLLATAKNQGLILQFIELSARVDRQLSEANLVKSYFSNTRIITSSTQAKHIDDMAVQQDKMDLTFNRITSFAFPGQSKVAEFSYQFTRGISEASVEDKVFDLINGSNNLTIDSYSVTKIFDAAEEQDIDIELIDENTLDTINGKDYSLEAKIRITEAVADGKLIFIPSSNVLLNNKATIGWFEINPETGETIDVHENGEHGIISYIITLSSIFLKSQYGIGFLTGVAVTLIVQADLLLDCCDDSFLGLLTKNALKQIATQAKRIARKIIKKAVKGGILFFLGVESGIIVAATVAKFVFDSDPPLPEILVGISKDDPNNVTNQAFELIPEPVFTLTVDDVQFPSLYRALIKNTSNTNKIYQLDIANFPSGFAVKSSLSEINVPSGETGVVGIMLIPENGLPTPNGIRLRNIVIRLRIYKNPPGITTMAKLFYKSQACALHPRHLLSGFIDFLA